MDARTCVRCSGLLPDDAAFCGNCGANQFDDADRTRARWAIEPVEQESTSVWFPFGPPSADADAAPVELTLPSQIDLAAELVPVRSGGTLPESVSSVAMPSGVDVEAAEAARAIQPGDSLTIELFCPRCGQRLGIPIARFLDDFACPRCGTVDQAARLVPRDERIIPPVPAVSRQPIVQSAVGSVAEQVVAAMPVALGSSPPMLLEPTANPREDPASDSRHDRPNPPVSNLLRVLRIAARLDDLTFGRLGWLVVITAFLVGGGQLFTLAPLQSIAFLVFACLLPVVYCVVLVSRLRDDAGLLSRRSIATQLRPAITAFWTDYRAAWEGDATLYERCWKRAAPLIPVGAIPGAFAIIATRLLGAEHVAEWFEWVLWGSWCCALLPFAYAAKQYSEWRKLSAARAATSGSRTAIAASEQQAALPVLRGARVFDLRNPTRALALRQQLGPDLLAHVVEALAAWRPTVARTARELDIQLALRRHLKRHLERSLGPSGAACVRDRVLSVKDERTDRDGRADVQVENIMIEVKKTLATSRDRERALEQASFYVRGWTHRSERAASRGPVILVTTHAGASFEDEFNALVASSSREDLPHLILAAGFKWQ